MKAIFIVDTEELDRQYPRLLPLFERVPETPEYTPQQLFDRAKTKKVTIGYCCDDRDDPILACAFEFIYYPNMTAINIIALAGKDLDRVVARFFDRMKDFARVSGAACIEALCIDGMAQLLKKYGFEKASTQVRVML